MPTAVNALNLSTAGFVQFDGINTFSTVMNQSLVTTFDSSTTWSKNASTVAVTLIIYSGGGGGGSGRQGSSTAAGGGGGGGAGTVRVIHRIPASSFTSPETVTIAAGGNGGGTQAGANTNGINGSGGGTSSLGGIASLAQGNNGVGGTTTTGNGGAAIATNYVYTWGNAVVPITTTALGGGNGGNVAGSNANGLAVGSIAVAGPQSIGNFPSGGGG